MGKRSQALFVICAASTVRCAVAENAVNTWIYVGELATVIVLSLVFDNVLDKLKEKFEEMGRRGEKMCMMMDCVTKEIMILGFISLLVYVATKTGAALTLARSIFPKTITVTEDDDPLAETFELIHMIIFCIMLVFIVQCSLLMHKASQQSVKWEGWEHARVHGKHCEVAGKQIPSMEQRLKDAGFLDETKKTLKDIQLECNPWKRIFQQGGVVEFLQWRAIRHEFMFPAETEQGVFTVPEPHFFHFHEYLSERLYGNFVELVEVDVSTWICACFCVLLLPGILSVGEYYYPIQSCLFSWALLLILYFFGVHIYNIYMEVTPMLLPDPSETLGCFEGTSHAALQRKAQTEKKKKKKQEEKEKEKEKESGRFSARHDEGPASPHDVPAANQSLSKLHKFRAKFRTEHAADAKDKLSRPWHIRLLQRFPKVFRMEWNHLPNEQERLFLLHEAGPETFLSFLELLMFLQAVNTAGYIVIWVKATQSWDAMQWVPFFVGLYAPWYNVMTLLPKVVSKLAIVTSVEYMKSKECIQGVIFETKKLQLLECLKLLEIAQIQGKLERLTTESKLDGERVRWWRTQYDTKFTKQKKKEIDKIFAMFDADSSGSINESELQEVLESMGFERDSPQGKAAKKIMTLVDSDDSGEIDKDEFKVLMAMAFDVDEDQARENSLSLFKKFDEDNSDTLTIDELTTAFDKLGVAMGSDGMAALVFQVFKDHKQTLNSEDFVRFLCGLQELAENR